VNTVQSFDPDGGFPLGVFVIFFNVFGHQVQLLVVGWLVGDAVGVVSLVVEHQNVLLAANLAPQNPLYPGSFALDPAKGDDFGGFQVALLVIFFAPFSHAELPQSDLLPVGIEVEVALASGGGIFVADADEFGGLDGNADLDDFGGGIASGLGRAALKHMPVGHQHAPSPQAIHQAGGHQVTGAVEAGFAVFGIEFGEAIANGHVGADNQHHIGEAGIAAIVDLVQDAPGCQHAHYRRFTRTRSHLAGVPLEGANARFPLPLGGFIGGNGQALEEVGTGFGEEDDGLDGFALGVEQSPLSLVVVPVLKQFQGGAGDAGVALRSPAIHHFPDAVDQHHVVGVESSGLMPGGELFAGQQNVIAGIPGAGLLAGRIHDGGSAPIAELGLLSFLDEPVAIRLLEGGVEDGGIDFVGHG
jgi:hypothetical protein